MRRERKVNSSQKERRAIWTAVFIQWRHWRLRNELGREMKIGKHEEARKCLFQILQKKFRNMYLKWG